MHSSWLIIGSEDYMSLDSSLTSPEFIILKSLQLIRASAMSLQEWVTSLDEFKRIRICLLRRQTM